VKSKEETAMPVSLNRKAYIFSASSALLLVIFGVMYQFNLSPFEEWFTFAILGVLAAASIMPFAAKGMMDEDGSEGSLAMFADLTPPPKTSFDFELPSLPAYRKINHAPSRIAATLVGLLILTTFGGGAVISGMLESSIPFEVFVAVVALVLLSGAALIVLFVAATTRELKLRQSFHKEIMEGLAAAGYVPVRTFNAEYTDDRRMLLRGSNEHYSWWKMALKDDTAEFIWDGSSNEARVWNTTQTGPIKLPSKKNTDAA
jgi:hypothetical protein